MPSAVEDTNPTGGDRTSHHAQGHDLDQRDRKGQCGLGVVNSPPEPESQQNLRHQQDDDGQGKCGHPVQARGMMHQRADGTGVGRHAEPGRDRVEAIGHTHGQPADRDRHLNAQPKDENAKEPGRQAHEARGQIHEHRCQTAVKHRGGAGGRVPAADVEYGLDRAAGDEGQGGDEPAVEKHNHSHRDRNNRDDEGG